jgi:prevent-host-death family protein
MSTYSVAEAKAHLPGLINRALAGEEVLITRHGKPVAELKAAAQPGAGDPAERAAALERFLAGMLHVPPGTPTSVELLNMIYDEPDA